MIEVDAVFQAKEAIVKMEEILANYPKAASLAREVGTFFGPNFYLQGKSADPSEFRLGNKGTHGSLIFSAVSKIRRGFRQGNLDMCDFVCVNDSQADAMHMFRGHNVSVSSPRG